MSKNPKIRVVKNGFSITINSGLVRGVDDQVKSKRVANALMELNML